MPTFTPKTRKKSLVLVIFLALQFIFLYTKFSNSHKSRCLETCHSQTVIQYHILQHHNISHHCVPYVLFVVLHKDIAYHIHTAVVGGDLRTFYLQLSAHNRIIRFCIAMHEEPDGSRMKYCCRPVQKKQPRKIFFNHQS